MPVQPRPIDEFTRGALLFGFSTAEFTPTGSSVPIRLGHFSAESIERSIETLPLNRGDSGPLTVDREIVSSFAQNLAIETFNFSSDLAQFIFGSESVTTVVADAAAPQSATLQLDGTSPFDFFAGLNGLANVNAASIAPTFQEIAFEAAGTGDGLETDFVLAQKIKALGDITAITVGGVDRLSDLQIGAATGTQIDVTIGEDDTLSGTLSFGTAPPSGQAIVVTYQPSWSGADFVEFEDYILDERFGRIRFLKAGADTGPFRSEAASASLGLSVDFTYRRNAHTVLRPGTQLTFDGSLVLRHLPDIGINLIWPIPSVTLRITDDPLEFGADNFSSANLFIAINDAGGSSRFGQMQLSNEAESNV